MNKSHLKKQINTLLSPEAEKNKVTIYYVNPITGKKTIFSKTPSDKELDVQVDSEETAETFLQLRNITPSV